MNMVIHKQTFGFLFSLLFASLVSISNAAEREPILVADLGPQMGPNGAMLLFHRSADW